MCSVRRALPVLLILALWPRLALAQDQGTAAITSPLEGAVVSGLVPLLGTATHPQFQLYELAFGYDPNPTDTWFSIGDPAATQIVNEVLGRWDTTGVTDGTYILRLRVYWSDRDFMETFVRGVRIQNSTPTPLAAVTETPPPAPTINPVTPTQTAGAQPVIVLPPTSTARPTPGPAGLIGGDGGSSTLPAGLNAKSLGDAFLDGVRITFAVFALMGVYVGLRALWRSRFRG